MFIYTAEEVGILSCPHLQTGLTIPQKIFFISKFIKEFQIFPRRLKLINFYETSHFDPQKYRSFFYSHFAIINSPSTFSRATYIVYFITLKPDSKSLGDIATLLRFSQQKYGKIGSFYVASLILLTCTYQWKSYDIKQV